MLEETQVKQLMGAFKRIFSLPITKSTFKELQTAIFNILQQDQDKSTTVIESLLNGEAAQGIKQGKFQDFIEEFSIPTRMSRDILEKGEFINFMSSDLVRQGNKALFINYVRRVDGEHFQFFAEPEGVIRLLEHFTGRLEEISRADKSNKFLEGHSEELKRLRDRFEKLV